MAIVQEILNQSLGFRLKPPPKGDPQVIEKGVDSEGKRQRARIYKFVCPNDRGEIFNRWLLRDGEAAERKTVSSSEQMAQQTPIDLLKDFAEPYLSDPSHQTANPHPVQEGALNVGTTVTRWGWGAARYVVRAFVDDLIVEITSVAIGARFTAFRSMLTPVLEGAP